MSWQLYQYRFPKREGLILQYNGGWGEIAPLPGWSKETLEEAKQEIFSVLCNGAKPTLPSVQFGLAATEKPLHPIKIPLCALNTPRQGCTHLKLKLKDLTLDQAISLVKQYIGIYKLRLDCNRAWTLPQALEFASHFSPSDFEYLEEPVKTLADLIHFSKLTHFPIAIDETLREHGYTQIPTLKAAIIKPTLSGSIPNLPIPIVLSSSYESSLGILHIAQLANPLIPQGLDTFTPDLLTPPLYAENGYLQWKGSKNPINHSQLTKIDRLHNSISIKGKIL